MQKEDNLKNVGDRTVDGSIDFHIIENYFGSQWLNYDRIFHFWVNFKAHGPQ